MQDASTVLRLEEFYDSCSSLSSSDDNDDNTTKESLLRKKPSYHIRLKKLGKCNNLHQGTYVVDPTNLPTHNNKSSSLLSQNWLRETHMILEDVLHITLPGKKKANDDTINDDSHEMPRGHSVAWSKLEDVFRLSASNSSFSSSLSNTDDNDSEEENHTDELQHYLKPLSVIHNGTQCNKHLRLASNNDRVAKDVEGSSNRFHSEHNGRNHYSHMGEYENPTSTIDNNNYTSVVFDIPLHFNQPSYKYLQRCFFNGTALVRRSHPHACLIDEYNNNHDETDDTGRRTCRFCKHEISPLHYYTQLYQRGVAPQHLSPYMILFF